ncbi:hypothetical protein BC830DRAFT_1174469 [Chytriomyces sp. MP71]|nr:hypothetical protein BC830DRAFT_1174469 [Chytriomyces sp. MP71]
MFEPLVQLCYMKCSWDRCAGILNKSHPRSHGYLHILVFIFPLTTVLQMVPGVLSSLFDCQPTHTQIYGYIYWTLEGINGVSIAAFDSILLFCFSRFLHQTAIDGQPVRLNLVIVSRCGTACCVLVFVCNAVFVASFFVSDVGGDALRASVYCVYSAIIGTLVLMKVWLYRTKGRDFSNDHSGKPGGALKGHSAIGPGASGNFLTAKVSQSFVSVQSVSLSALDDSLSGAAPGKFGTLKTFWGNGVAAASSGTPQSFKQPSTSLNSIDDPSRDPIPPDRVLPSFSRRQVSVTIDAALSTAKSHVFMLEIPKSNMTYHSQILSTEDQTTNALESFSKNATIGEQASARFDASSRQALARPRSTLSTISAAGMSRKSFEIDEVSGAVRLNSSSLYEEERETHSPGRPRNIRGLPTRETSQILESNENQNH